MRDVTDRVRMTSDLARSEDRLREAERMVGVGSWELVVASGEITYSAGLARLLELEEDQPLDKVAHLALVHPADRELVAGIGEQCVRHGSTSCEYRVVLPSGADADPVAARRGDHAARRPPGAPPGRRPGRHRRA